MILSLLTSPFVIGIQGYNSSSSCIGSWIRHWVCLFCTARALYRLGNGLDPCQFDRQYLDMYWQLWDEVPKTAMALIQGVGGRGGAYPP